MGNKEKAIELVKERDIKECLQWIMDNKNRWIMDNKYGFEVLETKEAGGKTYKGKKINDACLFDFNGNSYQLYYLSIKTRKDGYYGDWLGNFGDFILVFNRQIVYESTCTEDMEFSGLVKIDSYSKIKKLILKDWLDEIPKIVEIEKSAKEKRKEKEEKEKRIIEEENFDLGDFKE